MPFDAGSIQASLTLDRSPFTRELDAARSEAADFARETFQASVSLDLGRLQSDIRDAEQRLNSLGRTSVAPNLDLSTLAFDRQLSTVRTQLDQLNRQRVDITVSLSGGAEVLAELTAIRDLAKEVGDLSPTVHVSADGVETTLAQLAEVAAAAAAVGDANVNVGTSDSGGGGGGGGIPAMPIAIAGGLPPALGAISSALNAIPAAVATAVTAFATLKIGISGVGDALKQANTPAQLLAQQAALNALAPSARDTAQAILALGPAFQDVQKAVQQQLFTGLAVDVTRLGAALPALQGGLVSVAGGLNQVARSVLDVVTSSQGMQQINTILAQTHDTIAALAPGAAAFTRNLLELASQGSAFLKPLVTDLDNAAIGFGNMIRQASQTGQLAAAFSNLAGTVGVLLGFFNQLVEAGIKIEAEIGGQVNATLAALGRAIIAALPGLTSLAGAVLNLATGVVNALVPALQIVSPILSGIGTAFAALPGPIGAGVVALTAFSVISGRMGVALTGLKLEMALLPGIFNAAAAGASRFGLVAGTAAAAAGGLRAVGSALLTAFGGPWGLVIGGAVALLSIFGAQSAASAQQQKELAQAGTDVAQAIAQQNGVIDDNVRQTAAKKLSDEGLLATAQQLGINLGTLTDAATGNADAIAQVNSQLDAIDTAGNHGQLALVGVTQAQVDAAHTAEDFRGKLHTLVGGLNSTLTAQNLQTQAVNQAKTAQDLYNDSLTREVGIIQTSLGAALSYQSALLNVTSAHNSAVQAINQYGRSSLQAQQAVTGEEQAVLAAAKAAQDKAIADAGGAKAAGAQEAGAAAFKATLDKLVPTLSGPAQEALKGYTAQLNTIGANQANVNTLTQTQIDKLTALAGNIDGPTKAAVNAQIANLTSLASSNENANQKIADQITQLKLLAGETTGPLHDAALAQLKDLQDQQAAMVATTTTTSGQIKTLQDLAGQLTGPQKTAVDTAIKGLNDLSTAHLNAQDKANAQIGILETLASQTTGPVHAAIIGMISDLKSVPANVPVHVQADGSYTVPQGPGVIHGGVGAYASGGIMPGYTPGRDVHTFASPTGGVLHLSGGEAVMRPEWTAAVGAGYVHAANAAAASGGTAGVARFLAGRVRGGDGAAMASGGVVDLASTFGTAGITQYVQTRDAEIKLVVAKELELIKAAIAQAQAAAAAAGGSMSSGAAVALGQQMAAARGWTGAEFDALNKLWTRESGWNPNAVNPSSGAYGIPQALPAAQGHPYALGDAQAQIAWGLNYIAGRYGDPINAWAHETSYGWYDQGGWLLPGLTAAFNATGKPEAVLTAEQWQAVRAALDQGGATGALRQVIAKLTQGGGSPTPPPELSAQLAARFSAMNEQVASRIEAAQAETVTELKQVAQMLERRGAAATINVHDRSGDPAETARTTMLALRLS